MLTYGPDQPGGYSPRRACFLPDNRASFNRRAHAARAATGSHGLWSPCMSLTACAGSKPWTKILYAAASTKARSTPRRQWRYTGLAALRQPYAV